MTDLTIDTVAKFCSDNLALENAKLGSEYYNASMPLCVVDAVFSIGVRYEGVRNAMQRLCNCYDTQEIATAAFYGLTRLRISTPGFGVTHAFNAHAGY